MSEAQKILISMTCPACGGQVECEEGQELVICKFCDSVFALSSDEGIGKVMYKSTVTKDTANKKVKEWFKTGPKAKDLPSKAEITECYPLYLPFWRLIARGKACVCGVEIKKGSDKQPDRRIPHEALINREYIYSEIACDTGDLGIKAIRIPERAQAITYDDRQIVTFGVTASRSDAFESGCAEIKHEAIEDGKTNMDEVNFTKAFVFPKAFTLVYYPFWIVRYKYDERDYFATVDAITGVIASGRAPGDAGSQSTSSGIGGTVAGGVLGIGLGLAVKFFEDPDMGEVAIGALVIGLVASIFIFGYFYKRFRYGDEILVGALEGKGLKTSSGTQKIQTVYKETYDYIN